MKQLATLTLGVILTIAAASCSKSRIKGEGSTVTETRSLPSFKTVEADGSTDVEIYPSATNKVEVTGYENLVPVYETNVNNGRLVLKFKDKYINVRNSNIKVVVYTNEMNSFKLNGSGNIVVHPDISGTSMSAEINGSGNITIERNKFENLTCKVNGSGDIRAREAEAEHVDATISGSGNIEITATKTINARISGSGNIKYWGNGSITNVDISGSGNIKKQ